MSTFSRHFLLKIAGIFILIVGAMMLYAGRTPNGFPVPSEIHIRPDISLSETATLLAEKNIISSPFLFKVVVVALHGQSGIVAGDYVFSKREGVLTVANRLTKGDQQLVPIRVTIPEGSTVRDIAWILLKKIPKFDAPYFLRLAHNQEGYLFPDTYLFYPNESTEDIVKKLRDTFDSKIKGMATDIRFSNHTQKDIVIMASLLEREATSTNDRIIISGILWKRLANDMPLQVDATIVYLTGEGKVSIEDTKIDSPYNTYKNKGLPIGPIANPGLDALTAAAHPVQSTYFYYLSDSKGYMHYASTYEGHLENKRKYIK